MSATDDPWYQAGRPDVARLATQATMDMFPGVAPNIDGAMANDRYTTRATLEWCKRVLGVDAFDLDVAACVEAHHAPRWYGWQHCNVNQSPDQIAKVLGFSSDLGFVDGLTQPWNAHRTWCNPPYDDLLPWIEKAWAEMLASTATDERWPVRPIIGMLIPDNRREQPFWQRLIEPFRDNRWNTRQRSLYEPRFFEDEWTRRIQVALDAGVGIYTHSLPGRQPFGVPGNPEGVGQQSPPFGVVLLEWRF